MLLTSLCALLLATTLSAPPLEDADIIAAQLPTYPLTTCVMSDEPLGEDGVDALHEGRLVRFCCRRCNGMFQKDPAAALAKLDAAVVGAQSHGYPLTTCAACEQPLGEEAVDLVHGTRLVRVCSRTCAADAGAHAPRLLAVVDQAYMAAQRADYPLTTCPVSQEALEEDGVKEILHGLTLVRLCCNGCKRDFAKDPAAFVASVEAARRAAALEQRKARAAEDDGHAR